MILQKTSCEVGMHFGKLRANSVIIEKDEELQMPSEKRLVHSVSDRHKDDR